MSFLKSKWFWLILVIVIGGYIWYSRKQADTSVFVLESATTGSISQIVSASVQLVADREVDVNFETSGRLRTISQKIGAMVSEGTVLASIESLSLQNEVTKAQAALDRSQADAGVNDDALREAKEALKNAKQYADDIKDAEDQKVSAADAALDFAKTYKDDAQSYYKQVVSDDGADGAIAKSAKLTLTRAESEQNSAEENSKVARKSRDAIVTSAENAYQSQKEKVITLESKHQKIIENSAIAIAQANYDTAVNNASKATLKSPVNGILTQVNYDAGEVIGSALNTPFGRILSVDMILEAKVPESDISQIKLDQHAKVTFDALGTDELLDATVIEIDPASTIIQDVVYYKVNLRLANMKNVLKPGMSGDVDIQIAEKNNVTLVPLRAVKQDGVSRYVEVQSEDKKTAVRKDVKVGLEGSDGQVEILSGLKAGDEIIVETKK